MSSSFLSALCLRAAAAVSSSPSAITCCAASARVPPPPAPCCEGGGGAPCGGGGVGIACFDQGSWCAVLSVAGAVHPSGLRVLAPSGCTRRLRLPDSPMGAASLLAPGSPPLHEVPSAFILPMARPSGPEMVPSGCTMHPGPRTELWSAVGTLGRPPAVKPVEKYSILPSAPILPMTLPFGPRTVPSGCTSPSCEPLSGGRWRAVRVLSSAFELIS
mmetsp:Transcript_77134/g.186385  ORF Transcript_77134/g.186385 Transcript_77134/m.186385 type:complete len:216 (+) Transcript_77134:42-689(+)